MKKRYRIVLIIDDTCLEVEGDMPLTKERILNNLTYDLEVGLEVIDKSIEEIKNFSDKKLNATKP